MSIDPWPAESTNRSRSNQAGSSGLCLRNRVHRTTAASAIPIGRPGWARVGRLDGVDGQPADGVGGDLLQVGALLGGALGRGGRRSGRRVRPWGRGREGAGGTERPAFRSPNARPTGGRLRQSGATPRGPRAGRGSRLRPGASGRCLPRRGPYVRSNPSRGARRSLRLPDSPPSPCVKPSSSPPSCWPPPLASAQRMGVSNTEGLFLQAALDGQSLNYNEDDFQDTDDGGGLALRLGYGFGPRFTLYARPLRRDRRRPDQRRHQQRVHVRGRRGGRPASTSTAAARSGPTSTWRCAGSRRATTRATSRSAAAAPPSAAAWPTS